MVKPKKKQKKTHLKQKDAVDARDAAQKVPDNLTVTFLVKPSARSDRLYFEGDRGFLDIAAPPVKGKANLAIIKFLSKELHIPKSNIVLKRGHASHEKTFQISSTITLETLKAKYQIS